MVEVLKEVQVEVPVEVVPQEIKSEVERLRRDSESRELQFSSLEQQLVSDASSFPAFGEGNALNLSRKQSVPRNPTAASVA